MRAPSGSTLMLALACGAAALLGAIVGRALVADPQPPAVTAGTVQAFAMAECEDPGAEVACVYTDEDRWYVVEGRSDDPVRHLMPFCPGKDGNGAASCVWQHPTTGALTVYLSVVWPPQPAP